MDESDHDQDTKSCIKRNAHRRSALCDESVVKIFSDMLERSEARIDRTSNIIEELTKACKSVEIAYTSHVSSLQSSSKRMLRFWRTWNASSGSCQCAPLEPSKLTNFRTMSSASSSDRYSLYLTKSSHSSAMALAVPEKQEDDKITRVHYFFLAFRR